MPDQEITCPNCGTKIPLTALTQTIRDGLLAEMEEDTQKKRAELLKQEKGAKEKEKELAEREEALEDAVDERLQAEREKLSAKERERAEKQYAAKSKDLEEELEQQRKKVAESEKKELALLKAQRELEDAKQSLELNVERRLTEERKKVQEEASKRAEEAQQLKIREKDDLIETLKNQMGEMQRRAELGSQEAQGEALEGQLHETLSAVFPFDAFEEIKKGARGADIVQTVRSSVGAICGTILWETKNTKEFQKSWIAKLKEDQQAAGADIAVLMSIALPKGIQDFAFSEDDDIWLTGYESAVPLCTALRHGLIQVAREKVVSKHRDTFKDLVYDYVTGQEFARRIRAIADGYRQMREDLETEKRSMNRIWSKREKQIDVVLDNVTRMHGELEGLVGADSSLPGIASFMLESVVSEEDDDAEITP